MGFTFALRISVSGMDGWMPNPLGHASVARGFHVVVPRDEKKCNSRSEQQMSLYLHLVQFWISYLDTTKFLLNTATKPLNVN